MKEKGVIVILLLSPMLSNAASLGPAEAFNAFIFGNITQSNVDAQGRVAAGGNVSYTNFMVGTYLSPLNTSINDLVVGGALTATNLTVEYGSIAIASSTATSTIMDPTIGGFFSTYGSLEAGAYGQIGAGIETGGTFTNNYNNSGTVTNLGVTGRTPIATGVDFASAEASITQDSAYWATLKTTASTVVSYGSISVTGTNSTLDVFDINGSDLASANGLTITAPSGATVLLNINGTADTLSNFQITLDGTDDYHVLYNFYQATSLTDNNVSIEGSLLAPYAAISGSGDHINGTLIANSLTGGLEQHLYLFQGNLPAPVPEPATWAMFVIGMGLVAIARRRS